jgi:hypothetical protein
MGTNEIPLLGFAPDVDPTTPGVISDCNGMIPTLRGMRAASSAVKAGIPAIPGPVLGAVAAQRLNNTRRTVYGTATGLYEYQEVVREQAAAEATIGGELTGLTLTNAGSGYTSAPTVKIDGNGAGATATAQIETTLTEIRIAEDGARHYAAAPTAKLVVAGQPDTPLQVVWGARLYFSVKSPGSGLKNKPTLSLIGGTGNSVPLDCVVRNGELSQIWATSEPTGYLPATPPTVRVTLHPDDVKAGAVLPVVQVDMWTATRVEKVIAPAGLKFTSQPTVVFSGQPASDWARSWLKPASANAITSTRIAGLTLTNAGAGYTEKPTVTISGGGGTGATATASFKTYATGVVLKKPGAGYQTAPKVEVVGDGSGATASATIANGVLTGITLTAPGIGFTKTPEVKIVPPDDTGMHNIGRDAPYTTSSGGAWRFAQFGDATIAANGADPLQQAISGKFSDIPGAPVAKIVESVAGFVFALNTTDATDGARPDGWTCSGIYDQTVWTPSQATQCAKGRLIDTPGDIRAGKMLGADIIVYKETSMFHGTFQGPPLIWAFPCVSTQVGAPCQEAVVSIGVAHIFMGNDNFYVFDGTRPIPIGDEIKTWWLNDIDPKYRHIVRSVHDHTESLIYWYYVSRSGGGKIDHCVVYNYKAKKWGRADRFIECAVDFIQGNITWNNLGTLATTWADLPQIPYDAPFWTAVGILPSIVDDTHTVRTLTGTAEGSKIITGYFGDDEQYSTLQSVRPRFIKAPKNGSSLSWHADVLGNTPYTGTYSTMDDGRFDVDVSSRWHRMEMDFTGDTELSGFSPTLKPDGYA